MLAATKNDTNAYFFELDSNLQEILLSDPVTAESAPQLHTVQADKIASCKEISDICKRADAAIRNGACFCIFEVKNAEDLDKQQLRTIYWNLFIGLGKPIKQYGNSDKLIYEVTTTQNAGGHSAYSTSSKGEGCHTDGTFLDTPPFYVALGCIQPAQQGGESILVDGRAVFKFLQERDPKTAKVLQRNFHFDCFEQFTDVATRHRPIIVQRNNLIRIHFMRSYLDKGHEKMGILLTDDEIAALQTFEETVMKQQFRSVFGLNRGQMLVFNNHTLLHGRKDFLDSQLQAKKRLLLRTYAVAH